MQFTLYGVRYDTDGMRAIPTNDPAEPTIYIDQQSRVFVTRLEHDKAVIHWASRTEIRRLASRHRIGELALIAENAGDQPPDGVHI